MNKKPVLTSAEKNQNPRLGLLAVLGCNFVWGLLPLYWRALSNGGVPVQQIVAQRIIWSCVVVFFLLWFSGKLKLLLPIFKSRRLILGLVISSLLMSLNWLMYVGMVNSGRVLEASLGTYIGPLVTMAMGVCLFRNRLNGLQWLAIIFSVIGVGVQVYMLGKLPWAVLGMTVFGSAYGLLRTVLKVDSMPGLFIENLLAVPVVIGIMLWWQSNGTLAFLRGDVLTDLLVLGTGVITAFPMMWLVFGMRNAKYTSVGLANYLSPTMIFLMGVFVFKENFNALTFVSFAFIWLALIVYSVASFREHRQLDKTVNNIK